MIINNSSIGVINYGAGNFRSLCNALDFLKIEYSEITNNEELNLVDKIILPGVGAYADCINRLNEMQILETLKDNITKKNKPFLGICVGMQILSDIGNEFKISKGLGIIKGEVKKFVKTKNNFIPNMGWSTIKINKNSKLFKNINNESNFYFVHSYYFDVFNIDEVSSFSENDQSFPSSVEKDNIFGVQFHPEKSQKDGLLILNNFSEL